MSSREDQVIFRMCSNAGDYGGDAYRHSTAAQQAVCASELLCGEAATEVGFGQGTGEFGEDRLGYDKLEAALPPRTQQLPRHTTGIAIPYDARRQHVGV